MKPCDDLPGTCPEYPTCVCGRAWDQHEQRIHAAREGGAQAAAIVRPLLQTHRDIEFLNARGVHINTRGADGVRRPLSPETISAIAEMVRAFDKSKCSSEDSR